MKWIHRGGQVNHENGSEVLYLPKMNLTTQQLEDKSDNRF